MIPPKTLRALSFANKIAWYCGATPFRIVKNRNKNPRIKTSFTSPRMHFCYASFILNLFYLCFILFRVIQNASSGKLPLPFIVQMGYLFLSYTLPVVVQINTFKFWKEVPHFFQCYLTFFQTVKDNYFLPGERGPKCLKFFNSELLIGILVNLQNLIIILKKPDKVHFLTSVYENPLNTPLAMRLPLMFLHVWIWASTWSHVWTFSFHLYTYISCMVWTLRELDLKIRSAKTSDRLRRPKTFTQTLRAMHVLHRLWQNSHQAWFCPSHKAVAIAVGTLASYGVIKLSGPRSIIMGCMATLSLMYLWTLFRKFGQFYEISDQVRGNWMNSNHSTKWMKRFLTSVPIFRIDIGSFYYVKKTTVVNVLWIVLNNTITLLFL